MLALLSSHGWLLRRRPHLLLFTFFCGGEEDVMLCGGRVHGIWWVCGREEVVMRSILRSLSFGGDGGGGSVGVSCGGGGDKVVDFRR